MVVSLSLAVRSLFHPHLTSLDELLDVVQSNKSWPIVQDGDAAVNVDVTLFQHDSDEALSAHRTVVLKQLHLHHDGSWFHDQGLASACSINTNYITLSIPPRSAGHLTCR